MKKGSLNLVSQSIDTSGIPKDYKTALHEYIWNGFEAGATEIKILITLNELEGIDTISVIDNGEGIDYDNLNNTFGTFLSSQKNLKLFKVKSGDNKGKGRFSFATFSSLAKWATVYKKDKELYKYTITIDENSKNKFEYDDEVVKSDEKTTGTTVTFYNIKNLLPEEIYFESLEDDLLKEFSWFLYLNKSKNYKLSVNDQKVDYTKYINTVLSKNINQNINGFDFEINIVVWEEKIKERFCNYYYDSNGIIKGIETTSFNRNTLDFNHSVYVKSVFFDHRDDVSLVNTEQQMTIDEQEIDNAVLKELKKCIQNNISEIIKEYMIQKADKAVEDMVNVKKTFPHFSDDPYDQLRKNDLINVTKQIYCVEPKIFYKLKAVQEKSLLGFLNLLLVSEERENILTIIEQIVDLSVEQRKEFSHLLKKTTLKNIIETIKFIEQRYEVIEILKTLVYDFTSFTNERNHIQKIVEQHYWLFGDQYTMVSADVGMKKALQSYLDILYGDSKINGSLQPDEEEQRRMDIFLCGSRKIMNSLDNGIEENIIIELKAPKVILSKKVYRQIEDYMDYIRRQPQFNSSRRTWKFITVCKDIDDEVKSLYKSFEMMNKPGLVHKVNEYEIYALTWDDIFKSFDIRHSFILDKLNYQRDTLSKELKDKISTVKEKTADYLTETAIGLLK